ncbi:hypothetical protein LXL04_004162 [Taraxacum kok-saghyz]
MQREGGSAKMNDLEIDELLRSAKKDYYGRKCWDLLRTHIFPRTRELPQFPISPKPLFLSKNRLRNPPKPVLKQNKKLCTYAQKFFLHVCKFLEKKKSFFRKFFFATGLIFERFLAPRSRFFEKYLWKQLASQVLMYIELCKSRVHTMTDIYNCAKAWCIRTHEGMLSRRAQSVGWGRKTCNVFHLVKYCFTERLHCEVMSGCQNILYNLSRRPAPYNNDENNKVWGQANRPTLSTSHIHVPSIDPNIGSSISITGGSTLPFIVDVQSGPKSNVMATLGDDGRL